MMIETMPKAKFRSATSWSWTCTRCNRNHQEIYLGNRPPEFVSCQSCRTEHHRDQHKEEG